MDESTNPVGSIEGLLKTIRVPQNSKQQGRLTLVSGVENNHMEDQEFETRESSFSATLSRPITKCLVSYLVGVSYLLHDIVALLSCLYPDCGSLLHQTHYGWDILQASKSYEVKEQCKFCHQCKRTSELVASIALTCCCKLNFTAFCIELQR
jgi:hypothetical protein